jgi:hypothetical protein
LYWGFTPEELSRYADVPAAEQGQFPDLSTLTPDVEYRVERRALHLYVLRSQVGFQLLGCLAAIVAGGLSWRTLVLVLAVILAAPFIVHILAPFVWLLECNYRRLIGQFHDGFLPPAIRPSASHRPIAFVRRLAPALAAIGFVLALNAALRHLGL